MILVVEITSGKIIQEFHPQGTLQGLVAWSPDGTSIAAVDSYGIALFSVATEAQVHHWEMANTTIKSLSWSPDGKRLATRSAETLTILDTATGHRWQRTGRAISRVCFHRQLPWIACWYKDGVMEIWTHDLTQRIAIIPAPTDCAVRDLTWNEHLTAITRDGEILTWHMPRAGYEHPETTTNAALDPEQRAAFGLPPGLPTV